MRGMILHYPLVWIIDVYLAFSISSAPAHKSDRRKGLKNLVPYLKRERETWFVSLRVAAAHVYVLTFFVRNFGNCFDGDRISRWELLQNLLEIQTLSNITGITAAVRQILKHAHYCHSRRTRTSMRLKDTCRTHLCGMLSAKWIIIR